MYKLNGITKIDYEMEEEILKNAASYVNANRHLHKLFKSIDYQLKQCFLEGYMQAVAQRPREWQNGFDSALQLFENQRKLEQATENEHKK